MLVTTRLLRNLRAHQERPVITSTTQFFSVVTERNTLHARLLNTIKRTPLADDAVNTYLKDYSESIMRRRGNATPLFLLHLGRPKPLLN